MHEKLPPFLKARKELFLSLAQSQNPESIDMGWLLLQSGMSPTPRMVEFDQFCRRYGWGTKDSTTYIDAYNAFVKQMENQISVRNVEGSTHLNIYTVRGQTTNSREVAKYLAAQTSPAPPLMKYEYIVLYAKTLHEIVTWEERQEYEKNAAKPTRLITKKEEHRQEKER